MSIDWSKARLGEVVDGAREVKSVEEAVAFLREWRDSIPREKGAHPISAITSHLDYYVTEYDLPRPDMWADALILAFPARKATEQEIALGGTMKSWIGRDVKDVAAELAKRAVETGQQQRYEFNETWLVADPGMVASEVAANFYVSGGASRIRYLGRKRITQRISDAGEALLDALESMLKPFESKRDEELARKAAEAAIKKARGDA